jgi:hypothetical protein
MRKEIHTKEKEFTIASGARSGRFLNSLNGAIVRIQFSFIDNMVERSSAQTKKACRTLKAWVIVSVH